MPYDYYEHFMKERNNPVFTETTHVVRQKFWRESYNVVESQECEETSDKIRKN